jgi:nucleotide-binding universal stress UspA family protein
MVMFLDGCEALARTVEWTVGLAREHGARLTGVLVEEEHPPGPLDTDPEAAFEAAARHHGIRWAWRRVSRRRVVDLAAFGPWADLAVVARRPWPRRVSARLALAEFLALVYGRPTIVFPPAPAAFPPRRIIVGWSEPDGTLPLAVAMPLLERADSVEIVRVEYDDGPRLQEGAAGFARELAGCGVPAELHPLPCRAGDSGRALLSRASACGADLLVIGARTGSQRHDSVARAVLAEATVPVLICR